MQTIKCLFGFHDWGPQKNIRKSLNNPLMLFTPFFFLALLAGEPKECDRSCVWCGKTKTEPYP